VVIITTSTLLSSANAQILRLESIALYKAVILNSQLSSPEDIDNFIDLAQL
jgi:hypothetical protein